MINYLCILSAYVDRGDVGDDVLDRPAVDGLAVAAGHVAAERGTPDGRRAPGPRGRRRLVLLLLLRRRRRLAGGQSRRRDGRRREGRRAGYRAEDRPGAEDRQLARLRRDAARPALAFRRPGSLSRREPAVRHRVKNAALVRCWMFRT